MFGIEKPQPSQVSQSRTSYSMLQQLVRQSGRTLVGLSDGRRAQEERTCTGFFTFQVQALHHLNKSFARHSPATSSYCEHCLDSLEALSFSILAQQARGRRALVTGWSQGPHSEHLLVGSDAMSAAYLAQLGIPFGGPSRGKQAGVGGEEGQGLVPELL